ncbi:GNAT family N-acetyltransferase [Agrococcus jejuensis]|uniref:Acetyltransferase (GNAT) domain-containing protein n=1 Tax=Agrococcus jejuensis TaxID=399736 RepID=A0A1G8H3R5_9MICO|nr:GNAT family N-acetyltransferase [Agrococcus jejuensis]SDI01276.1 Acetyltransferase (GNAT) domain-containing protein [Agrococcus jejuensis]
MHIRPATLDEARQCAGIVAAALLHDPVGVRAVRSRHDRLRRMTSLYEAELRLGGFMHGHVDVAVVDDEIVGVAAWVEPDPCHDMRATLRQAPLYVHAVGIAHAVSAARVLRTRQRARPTQPHWLLADVAVAEPARGLGIGAALIDHGLARFDGPAYLEATTAASQRLYERHGFTLRSRIGIAPGGFPVGMWREPRVEHALR